MGSIFHGNSPHRTLAAGAAILMPVTAGAGGGMEDGFLIDSDAAQPLDSDGNTIPVTFPPEP